MINTISVVMLRDSINTISVVMLRDSINTISAVMLLIPLVQLC